MFESFSEFYFSAGIMAHLILFVWIVLFPLGVALLFIKTKRKYIYFYLLICFIPILLGGIGTFIFHQNVYNYYYDNPDEDISLLLEQYKETIWSPFYFGLYASLPLLIIGVINIAIPRRVNTETLTKPKIIEEHIPKHLYANLFNRIIAFIIDYIIYSILGGIVFLFLTLIGSVLSLIESNIFLPISIVILIAFIWLYHAILESSNMQGTIGKYIFKIIVTDLNGNKISFGKATARYFSKWLSGMILGFGFLMAFFTEGKQTLHDIIASTIVVNRN